MKKVIIIVLIAILTITSVFFICRQSLPDKGVVEIRTGSSIYRPIVRVRGYRKNDKIKEFADTFPYDALTRAKSILINGNYEISFDGDVFMGPYYDIYDYNFQYMYGTTTGNLVIPEQKGIYYLRVDLAWGDESEYIVCRNYFKIEIN